MLTDPLTALNLALLASFAVGLLFTSGRRRTPGLRERDER